MRSTSFPAVGIGRPLSIATIGGGAAGVALYLNTVQAELTPTMILTGCKTIADADIGPEALFR